MKNVLDGYESALFMSLLCLNEQLEVVKTFQNKCSMLVVDPGSSQ